MRGKSQRFLPRNLVLDLVILKQSLYLRFLYPRIIAGNVNALLAYIRDIMLNISSNSLNLEKSSFSIADSLSDASKGISEVSAL